MNERSLILKLCSWPHSLWIGFLTGLLIGWLGTLFSSEIDSLFTESGKRVMIFSWGILVASGSTLDLPGRQSDSDQKTSVFRRRLRRLFVATFVIAMTYAFVFLAPEPETHPSEQSGDRKAKNAQS